jgi:hypothetical protein
MLNPITFNPRTLILSAYRQRAIDLGWDPQEVNKLTLSQLKTLEFSDYNDRYLDDILLSSDKGFLSDMAVKKYNLQKNIAECMTKDQLLEYIYSESNERNENLLQRPSPQKIKEELKRTQLLLSPQLSLSNLNRDVNSDFQQQPKITPAVTLTPPEETTMFKSNVFRRPDTSFGVTESDIRNLVLQSGSGPTEAILISPGESLISTEQLIKSQRV